MSYSKFHLTPISPKVLPTQVEIDAIYQEMKNLLPQKFVAICDSHYQLFVMVHKAVATTIVEVDFVCTVKTVKQLKRLSRTDGLFQVEDYTRNDGIHLYKIVNRKDINNCSM